MNRKIGTERYRYKDTERERYGRAVHYIVSIIRSDQIRFKTEPPDWKVRVGDDTVESQITNYIILVPS